ncbi:hypothetical protein [Clostridium felsineum]|uniref:hypothetical protein n=1 Tax=Clostridium felsineum TaxID=36839 RepID=UPI001180CC90|nr:hypothetical protein [Clostridium felsineum]
MNNKQIELLVDNMELWDLNHIVYPSQIKSMLFIKYKSVYEVLDVIRDLGILEYNYQIYCSKCERFLDKKILRSLNEFPEVLYCDENHKLKSLEDTILIYRVIKE